MIQWFRGIIMLMDQNFDQLRKIVAASIALLVLGTVGFTVFERISTGEAFYQTTLILLSHFDHYGFHSTPSRWLVVILVIGSLITIVYILRWLAEYMIGLGDGLKRRQVKAKAAKLHDHYIVCGLGRVGAQVMEELSDEGVDFIGIDRDEDRVKEAIAAGYVAFVGDSTNEDTLKTAGIERAKGLVGSLGDDASNLFVTLAARQLNPGIFIVARANKEENKQRLSRAGADKIAMPYQIGGYHMATMMIRPNVVDVLEILSTNKGTELQVEELIIPKGSQLVGEKLSTLSHHKIGATILAINSNDGASKVNPSGAEVLYAGDKLILMGTRSQLDGVTEYV